MSDKVKPDELFPNQAAAVPVVPFFPPPVAQPTDLVIGEEKKEEEKPAEEKSDEEKAKLERAFAFRDQYNKLHEELLVIMDGREESEIGVSEDEPYWKKLNQIRQLVFKG